MSTIDQDIAVVVSQVVASYMRRCWWAEENDLRQEAWTAALDAKRTWDVSRGPVAPYVSTAVRRALAAYLLAQSAPVSAPWHKRHDLIGIQRAPIEDHETADTHTALPKTGSVDDAGWADRILANKRWNVRVLARLMEVVGDNADGLDELLREEPAPVGRPPYQRKISAQIARQRIQSDPTLKDIWDDKEEK